MSKVKIYNKKVIEFEGVKIICIDYGEREYYAAENSLQAYEEFFKNVGDEYIADEEKITLSAVKNDFAVLDENDPHVVTMASEILKQGVKEDLKIPFLISSTVY